MKGFTTKQAADFASVSTGRVRQLCLDNKIDHTYFGKVIVISRKGLEQVKNRNTKRGRILIKEQVTA
jgi:hypothetical protein